MEIETARPAGGVGRDKRPRPRVNDRSSATSARHTGQRSKCSSIATRVGRDTQSSTYNESDCLVSSHNISKHESKTTLCAGWLTDPGCSLLSKEATPTSQRATPSGLSERCFQRVLLATFSNTPSSCHYGSLEPAVSSLRPIWHRVFVSRGGSAIRITKILPAFAGVPGARAPVWISQFPR